MKIGLFWDGAINIKSYYVKNGTAYDLETNQPYMYHHTVSEKCFPATHNFTFLWDNGYFLNLSEFVEKGIDFPDLEFDVIFYAAERGGLTNEHWDDYSVKRIKAKYPNATIVGYLKEVHVREDRVENRIKFLKSCDYIHAEATSTMKTLPEFLQIEKLVGKKLQFTNQPLNIDYLFEHFYSNEKINGIYAYIPNPTYRHGRTYEFAKYIGNKYNLPVFYKTQIDSINLSQLEFTKSWSQYLYHFNLDPSPFHPGGQVCQVASVGSINIGGMNESHSILFPETSGIDEELLEKKFVELLNNPQKQFEIIQYAFNKLNEMYSFNVVKKQIESLYA
tara:strand:+ start:3062 stop:4060 length:999 start_codon:yes stop_codon:yes gene_type:complete